MDMDEIPKTISERHIQSNNHAAENNHTLQERGWEGGGGSVFFFPIMLSNAFWQTLLICIDIYVFAMITRDWLEKTESMIERENTLST